MCFTYALRLSLTDEMAKFYFESVDWLNQLEFYNAWMSLLSVLHPPSAFIAIPMISVDTVTVTE
jgi:hypothetical protein